MNLSAGLEDSLISALMPPWNGKGAAINAADSEKLPSSSPKVASPIRRLLPGALPPNTTAMQSPVVDCAGVPSADALFGFCKTLQGETLRTMVRKTQFRVEVVDSFLEITPALSGGPRRESKATISGLLARFDKTRSFQMSDYQDVSFNASYVLALVKAWQSHSHSQATQGVS